MTPCQKCGWHRTHKALCHKCEAEVERATNWMAAIILIAPCATVALIVWGLLHG